MSLRNVILLFCVALLATSWNVSSEVAAQPDPAWWVMLYDHGLNSLVELAPSGINVLSLPDIGFPPREMSNQYRGWYRASRIMVTDDRRYLVSLIQRTDPYVREAIITDLVTKQIIPVAIPPLIKDEVFVSYSFGAFNPAMTQIALPYVSHVLTSGFGCCGWGGIAVVDLATGAILHTLNIKETYNESTAWVDDWTEEGIWFSPRCSACTPPTTFTYNVWDPLTDSVVETRVFKDALQSEQLPATGELLYSENHPDFFLGGSVSYDPPNNAVVLYQAGEYPPSDPGQVVYYDEHNLDFDDATWIMNGQAFLVEKREQHSVVVLRNGQQLTIDYPNPEHFIAPTSDGWLTFDRERQQVQHYIVTEAETTRRTLYQAQGEVEVAHVHLPPINELPPFEIDITPPDEFFCPGALPSRLQPGDWAEVIADHEEAPILALMVGDVAFEERSVEHMEPLPLGAHVQVLEGAACANGWVYVKVRYQDTVGWILELYQMDYFLNPVSLPPGTQ
jgi:hypothetical protein